MSSSKFDLFAICQINEQTNREEFIKLLEKLIESKLIENPSKFWNDLYRLDVNEDKVRNVFNRTNKNNLYKDLAELIYDRQIQKIISRSQHNK